MAKLYEWEAFLRPDETDTIQEYRRSAEILKGKAADYTAAIDAIRRKAVQRARNALNKRLRAENRERSQ